jgi:hypothetical protein
MTKWEYASLEALYPVYPDRRNSLSIEFRIFGGYGLVIDAFDETVDAALGWAGSEGWEMVSAETLNTAVKVGQRWHFKRPIVKERLERPAVLERLERKPARPE